LAQAAKSAEGASKKAKTKGQKEVKRGFKKATGRH
jgi:hypothetical protein